MIFRLSIIFIVCISLSTGCISLKNPSDNNIEKQIAENPKFENEIRQHQILATKRNNELNRNTITNHRYSIQKVSNISSSFALDNLQFNLNDDNNKFLHTINIRINCGNGENFFSVRPLSRQRIFWKLSETIKGDTITSLSGNAEIKFYDSTHTPHELIQIEYKHKIKSLKLIGENIVNIESDLCDN